jgi:DnaJ-domain-containing protein 1
MFENDWANRMFSSPSGGSYNKLPEFYNEYQEYLDERILREKEERERQSQADYDKFKNFFNQNFHDYGKRDHPVDFEFEEHDAGYPFSVFGLKKSASQEDMKKAYHKAARDTHPDKTGENTEDEFREIQEAYEYYTNYL